MKRAIIFVIVLAVVAGIVGGFVYFQYYMKPQMVQQAMMAGGGPPPVTVTAEEAKAETWQPKLPAIGTLVAVRGIDIAPEVGGIVDTVHIESGQDVEAGDPLVSMNISVEQADLESGQAQLKRANLDLERQRDLLQRGNTPRASYDAAVAARDTAAADVSRVRAVIEQKRIEAPFAGRLGISQVDPGQYVSPGTALVTLQQLDPIYADFPLPEQYLDRLSVGQIVEMRIDAFPQATFSGAVEAIDAKVDQETRNILLRAQVPNPGKRLLPGMFANVAVLAGQPRQVVTVPRTAVTFSLYGDSLYVVKAPEGGGQAAAGGSQEGAQGGAAQGGDAQGGRQAGQAAERRFVRTGETREGRIEILEGVKAGETVVSSGQLKLHPGARVTIDNSRVLKAPDQRPKE